MTTKSCGSCVFYGPIKTNHGLRGICEKYDYGLKSDTKSCHKGYKPLKHKRIKKHNTETEKYADE